MRTRVVVVASLGVLLLLVAWPRHAHGRRPPVRDDRPPARDDALGPDDPDSQPDGGDVEEREDAEPADVEAGAHDDPARAGSGRHGRREPLGVDEEPAEAPRVEPPPFDEVRPIGPASPAAPIEPGAN